MSVSMDEAVGAVRGLLEKRGWKYEYSGEDKRFQLGFGLSGTRLKGCAVLINVCPRSDDGNCCSYIASRAMIGVSADSRSMAGVCEYLTRANSSMLAGNFVLDFSDGEVTYRVSCNARDALPGEDALDDLITVPCVMFNRYGDGLLAVSMGTATPEEAIAQIEGG